MDTFTTFLKTMNANRPKKAGDRIPCLKCHGKGYTAEGLTRDYPVECDRCHGEGFQIVRER